MSQGLKGQQKQCECGADFFGHAKFCPSCTHQKRREKHRIYTRNKLLNKN